MNFDQQVSIAMLKITQLPFYLGPAYSKNYWYFKSPKTIRYLFDRKDTESVIRYKHLSNKNTFYVNSQQLKKTFPVLALV